MSEENHEKDTFDDFDARVAERVGRSMSVIERDSLGKALEEVKKVS